MACASARISRKLHVGRSASICVFVALLGSSEVTAHPDDVKLGEYFHKTTEDNEPQPVDRVSGLTLENFEALALTGRPFVVEDAGSGHPFVGWTCERFREEFPNGIVSLEYVRDVKDPKRKMTDDWISHKHRIKGVDDGGPKYAPWYWGVKAADDPEEARSVYQGGKNPLPRVQQLMKLPPWMRATGENKQEVFGSPEFWFSAPEAGAQMHMDAHCESTFAVQLSGKRKWRLGWVPPVPNGTFYSNGVYGDGAVYGKDYEPPLEAVVEEGEGFFMPSGFLHETSNIGDGCAVSLTVQLKDPMPAGYFRAAARHLRRTGDFNECWTLMARVAALGQKVKGSSSTPSIAPVDKDKDGKFSFDEASTALLRASHAFHDLDEDGFVTQAEVESGWQVWSSANQEAKSKGLKKTKPKSFEYLKEGWLAKADVEDAEDGEEDVPATHEEL
eukprot:TRINITY_DN122375_c0_g1_i1.p1 TRINITY_DN122375_c0_g1~~TRINITY_DN122375_c0_g1_i1.p1  ORF type:complete len:444 (+),score=89.77 TRINITY_DN122375_c0_g1_i1:116-1447(+)